MITSADDARLLFTRWLNDEAPLRIRLRSPALILEGVGSVQSFDSTMLSIGGEGWQVTVPLGGASYTFSDPREATLASVRAAETARYEFGLALDLASGDRLALMEMKVAHPEPASDGSE